MKIDIYVFSQGCNIPANVGYIEMEKFDADTCFNLCNWIHWTDQKPENLYSEISSACHGICFSNHETDEMWLAKSVGWFVGNCFEVANYVNENKDNIFWQ